MEVDANKDEKRMLTMPRTGRGVDTHDTACTYAGFYADFHVHFKLQTVPLKFNNLSHICN